MKSSKLHGKSALEDCEMKPQKENRHIIMSLPASSVSARTQEEESKSRLSDHTAFQIMKLMP